MGKNRPFATPATCPVCGASVPPRALACPECGADERCGWDEEATGSDGLNLPDDELDYDAFMEREFGTPRPRPANWTRWVAAVLIVAILVWLVIRR